MKKAMGFIAGVVLASSAWAQAPAAQNYDRAQTIASIERIKLIEKNLKATVIIQHDPRDVGKLPTFPQSAK